MEDNTMLNDVRVISFAAAKLPVFIQPRGNARYVKFGEDNLYPDYLQKLYDDATKHGAIIDGKVTYIAGNGWQTKDGALDPMAQTFISKVNRYGESLPALTAKMALDIEIFYGAYLQVIWNNAGTQIAEVYHIDYTRMRSNTDNTQFYYKEDWSNGREVTKVYPAFNPANPRGSQIVFMKVYRPGQHTYPLPAYMRAVNYISAEIEVGKHTFTNSQSGFTPSKSITLVNGEPSDDEKRKITKRFEKAFTGSEGKKFVLWFTNGAERKPIIDDLGVSDLSKEDFTAVDTLIQSNIFAGHQITTPALFGISTPGSLGQRTELRDGYEIFKKTYVNDRQQFIEAGINRIARYFGVSVPLQIIPTEPLSIDISTIKDIAPKAWLLEQLGIDPAKYPEAGAEAANPGFDAETNPLLRDITGRQWQGIKRIIREVESGKITDAIARMMLTSGYGLNNEQISTLLGSPAPGDELKMSAQDDDDLVIALFAECGTPKDEYFSLKRKKVLFADEADELYELHFKAAQVTTLEANVLDLISKDKLITPEALAQALKVDIDDIRTTLRGLIESGSIQVKEISGNTIRELTAPLKELQEGVKAKTREYAVKYSYEGPQDSRNRPFCARLMELNRFYTRKEIESISQRLGYSVWDRRGGFYHNPNTDKTQPFCRHSWYSHVVLKS